MVAIRPARREDAALLTAIAMRSKAHWGYDAAFLEACRPSLTVSADDCDSGSILVAVDESTVVGFAQVTGSPPVGELDDLWVDPDAMGKGAGRALFEAATAHARAAGFQALTIDADPHAESFYVRMGATHIGESRSTVDPDRLLPLLRIDLDKDG